MEDILTGRLTLRPISLRDVDAVHALWANAAVRRYLWDDVVIPRERAEETVQRIVASFERSGRGMWLIFESGADVTCGFCGFLPHDDEACAELIYGLVPGVWGRGYATESARAVVDYAFDTLEVPRIVAAADVPNTASVRVMERLGMRLARRETVNGLELVFYEIENPASRGAAATASPDMLRR